MAVFRCKMCGGDLPMTEGASSCTCEFCGTEQTIPTVKDENLQGLFNRANVLRMKSEFDKAEEIYERILQSSESEAEAYWGLILCKYGIEYVEDPTTFKRIPTCHRTSYDAITADEDYRNALKYADVVQRGIYEAEAKAIDEIQKGILAISQKEDPYDVFICYKETDENGKRTQDSVIANDIYYQLTQEGFKVFYAAITLEDKLGSEYEPYIFSALNTAKVMLSLGTKPEYFSAVWVKNEWSRFLKLMKKDRSKMLIPCYRDMDAYELPEEFAHLQAQDMSKIGFINDLVRGIKKVVTKDDKATSVKETVVVNGGSTSAAPLLKRAVMFLEDGDWAKADDFCEQVLNIDPENSQAYVGKLMAELKVHRQSDLVNCADPFDNRNSYKKAVRFASPELRDELEGYVESIKDRNETNRLNGIYNDAEKKYAVANTEAEYKEAAEIFQSISNWKDASKRVADALAKAEEARKNKIYDEAVRDIKSTEPDVIMSAVPRLESIAGWKDATEIALTCPSLAEEARKQLIYNAAIHKAKMNTIDSYKEAICIMQEIKGWKEVNSKISEYEACICDLNEKAEANRRAEAQREKERKAAAAKKRRRAIVLSLAACACIAIALVMTQKVIPENKYSKAQEYYNSGNYEEAVDIFTSLNDYKDSKYQVLMCYYQIGCRLNESGKKAEAAFLLAGIDTDEAQKLCNEIWDEIAFRNTIAGGNNFTTAIKTDGTVESVGSDYCDVCTEAKDWKDVIAITGADSTTIGLKSDGTIVQAGYMIGWSSDFSDWNNIVSISISSNGGSIAGLKSDGTCVAAGGNSHSECNVFSWTDIIAISMGAYHTVGLKADGTCVAVGDNESGACNVSGWTDIVAISAGDDHTVGLKSDGTCVATGEAYEGSLDIDDWRDIIAIDSSTNFVTVGLKSDGTVVAVGSKFDKTDSSGYMDVSKWTDIVAIDADSCHIVGLKSDGTLVATGLDNRWESCAVSSFKGIKIPNAR